eukprot:6302580-Amphidinium_carterae.6
MWLRLPSRACAASCARKVAMGEGCAPEGAVARFAVAAAGPRAAGCVNVCTRADAGIDNSMGGMVGAAAPCQAAL